MEEIKITRAYERLNEFALFCEDYESFKAIFFDNLEQKGGKSKEAIELLLMVNFKLLKSDGEKFNLLLKTVDIRKREQLQKWLNDNVQKVGA